MQQRGVRACKGKGEDEGRRAHLRPPGRIDWCRSASKHRIEDGVEGGGGFRAILACHTKRISPKACRDAGLWRGDGIGSVGTHVLALTSGVRTEYTGFWCMLGGPGSRRQPHLACRRRWWSSRQSSTSGPLSRRRRPSMTGGQLSAGSKQVRGHNRERGPYPLTASPSDGPGVRRFSPPAIDSRRRGKSLR